MNLFFLSRRFRKLNVPSAILLALLQRTPVVRVLVAAESAFVASPVANVLRSVLTAVASLGAIQSMAGATPLVATPSSATNGLNTTVGASVNVFFTVTGTQTPPASWHVSGTQFPGGLDFSGLKQTGTVNVQDLNLKGTPTQAGTYTVTITAYEGPNASLVASPDYTYTITVTGSANSAPSITTQPTTQNVAAGGNATFSVTATGTPTPTYQWRKGGVNIATGTSATLTLSNVQASDAGAYSVVVTNSVSSVTSNDAQLNVGPAITTQPQAQTATAGGSASFTVAATGSPTPTYQWKKDGTNVSGGTGATLTLSNVTTADAGSYTVVVTNSVTSVTSNAAALTVNAAPTAPAFTQQPSSQTVVSGASVSFSAAVSSSSNVTYQWKKDGVALTNGGNISGATTATLTLASVGSGDVGNYTLVATNSVGATTSNAATLALGTPSNRGRIINMSVRTDIAAGEEITFGYYTGGAGTSGTKTILMRAMGPTLGATFSIPNTLGDPFLKFFNGSTQADQNDNWGGSSTIASVAAAVGAFPFMAADSKDAAILRADVNADSAHSLYISGANNTSGNVLAELYDTTPSGAFTTTTPRLINVSLRKNVGAFTTVGFVIDGATPVKVLIRAVGPTLGAAFGIPGVIADPQIAVYHAGASNSFAANDDWSGNTAVVDAQNQTGAFGLLAGSKDAAIVLTLDPGGYTAQVSAATGATGVALIEVYELP